MSEVLQTSVIISIANRHDLPAITDIYNHAIIHTNATFDTHKKSIDEMIDWFESHSETCPVLVAKSRDTIAGWASLSPWSDRCAYSRTMENSVYVNHLFRKQGIGKLLLDELIRIAKINDYHSIIARVSVGNPGSMKLHSNAGFETIGVMNEVGYKFNQFHNVAILQLML